MGSSYLAVWFGVDARRGQGTGSTWFEVSCLTFLARKDAGLGTTLNVNVGCSRRMGLKEKLEGEIRTLQHSATQAVPDEFRALSQSAAAPLDLLPACRTVCNAYTPNCLKW
jgi:hypothetical protein